MADKTLDETLAWLIKSERDLITARILASHEKPIFDYAIFHCQQAAEKAIKGLLTYDRQPIPRGNKGHDLEHLISCAAKLRQDIDSRIAFRHKLTKFAVETRYPNYGFGDIDEFNFAIENAESFYQYILSILPSEVHPPK